MPLKKEIRRKMADNLPPGDPNIPQSRTKYDENIRASARALWEISALPTREIAEKLGVAKDTISRWAEKENWLDKNLVKEAVIPEITRSLLLEKLANQGLPPEVAMQAMVDGLTKPEEEIAAVKAEDGSVVMEGVVDYKTRHKYLETYLKLTGITGGNSNSGLNLNNTGEGNINVIVEIPALKPI